ncbi:MAG: V-type ATP synthase subunit A, partial [Chlamydiia bacterium]|nr:V-type ATP synthase subunit A [Chlamydiia bacterium]
MTQAKGKVVKAFGNLLQVRFEGDVRQGEVAFVDVGGTHLKSEVIEIVGDQVKLQVYEDTRGIKLNTLVAFTGDLLEAELGPGLLESIFDGLQNRLEVIAQKEGYFLPRGVYVPAIDREKEWEYLPKAKIGDFLERGDTLGTTKEGRFDHHIMVPFAFYGKVTLTWVISAGRYAVDTVVARGRDERGQEVSFTMVQKWPIKMSLFQGTKVKPSKMMDTGLRTLDTQNPIMKGGTFCTPGPFGAGKTVIQHHLSKYASVDI